jgi:hypothetical protein
MLFLYSLLFFVLGASVVAFPVSPPTSHSLSRRTYVEEELNGFWIVSVHFSLISTYINRHQQGNSRVIHIQHDAIVWAYPKFKTRPSVKNEWIRVTEESIKVSGFTANLSLAFDMCFFVGSEISRRNTESNSNRKDRTS